MALAAAAAFALRGRRYLPVAAEAERPQARRPTGRRQQNTRDIRGRVQRAEDAYRAIARFGRKEHGLKMRLMYDLARRSDNAESNLKNVRRFLEADMSISEGGLDCGAGVERHVCREKHLGASSWQILTNGTWIVEECRLKTPDWENLVTAVVDPELKHGSASSLAIELGQAYPGIKIVGKYLGDGDQWPELLSAALKLSTPFILVARDVLNLLEGDEWVNLRRSLRLLQDTSISVVAGASRNSTGHWRANCYQADVYNFNLLLKPGYAKSECDCMRCDVVGNAPFVIRASALSEIPLLTSLDSAEGMFTKLFLDLKYAGYTTLLCPDLMYSTERGSVPTIPKSDWRRIAEAHNFLGVITDHSPKMEHVFSCSEVGLECDPLRQSEEGLLEPWCCMQSFLHILSVVDELESELGIHYEISSGSALGAVKLGSYLPWDIDGELFVQSEKIHLLRPGRRGHDVLLRKGMTTSKHMEDAYWDRGLGYFVMSHKGFEFEVSGKNGRISWESYFPRVAQPTRILIGNIWIRTLINPGLYARSRYGRGYLRHAQSWRYEGLGSAYDNYESGSWKKACSDPRRHDCLQRYPADGNVDFHPHNFRQWNHLP